MAPNWEGGDIAIASAAHLDIAAQCNVADVLGMAVTLEGRLLQFTSEKGERERSKPNAAVTAGWLHLHSTA